MGMVDLVPPDTLNLDASPDTAHGLIGGSNGRHREDQTRFFRSLSVQMGQSGWTGAREEALEPFSATTWVIPASLRADFTIPTSPGPFVLNTVTVGVTSSCRFIAAFPDLRVTES